MKQLILSFIFIIFIFAQCKKKETIFINNQINIIGVWKVDSNNSYEKYYEFKEDNTLNIYYSDSAYGNKKETYVYKKSYEFLQYNQIVFKLNAVKDTLRANSGSVNINLKLVKFNGNNQFLESWVSIFDFINPLDLNKKNWGIVSIQHSNTLFYQPI